MVVFKSISSFRKRLSDMLSIKRGVYSGITNEIKNEFENASIDNIRNNRDMILIKNDAIIIKLRLPDKDKQISKANGYRLIYMVSTLYERVVFLDVYPKRGPLQQLDIDKKDLMRLLLDFNSENEEGSLVDYVF